MKLFKKLFPGKSARERRAVEIALSDTHFQVIAPPKVSSLYAWGDIKEIRAVVDKDEDGDLYVVIKLHFDNGEVNVPRGCKGYKSFKNKIVKFNDFASSNYNQAIECNDTQQFILWRRKISPDKPRNNHKSQKTA